jgi:exonuclease III
VDEYWETPWYVDPEADWENWKEKYDKWKHKGPMHVGDRISGLEAARTDPHPGPSFTEWEDKILQKLQEVGFTVDRTKTYQENYEAYQWWKLEGKRRSHPIVID